jgi:hypothetical protein
MSAEDGVNRERCSWCNETGMVTAYHRDYRGKDDVFEERSVGDGEFRPVRVPGIIAVHCHCNLGAWMHRNTDEKIRHRIPAFAQILGGSGRYGFERADADDPGELSDAAKGFLRRWKKGFRFSRLPKATRNDPVEMSNQLRAREIA